MVRIIAPIVLLLCVAVGTNGEFALPAAVIGTLTPTRYNFYPGTVFSWGVEQRKHSSLRGAEKRRLLEDEDRRSLAKKAKYLEDCVRAKCTKGQQCSDVGTCQACKIGTFASAKFVLRCTECPAGTHGTEAVDKDEKGACKPCPPGFYTDKTGQAKCTACYPGTYQNATGATECIGANRPDAPPLDLCNDTHFIPEGATDPDTATTHVARNGAVCPSEKRRGGGGLSQPEMIGLCVGVVCAAALFAWCMWPCCCKRD
jgi:hypothetical protein